LKEILFDSRSLILFQRYSRNLIALHFIVLTVLNVCKIWSSETAIYWGVVGVLILAFLRVFIFAQEFRKAGLYRFSLLSYLLGIILLSTVVLRFWV